MNVEMIKELIQAFKEAGLTELSLKCNEFELSLGKEVKQVNQTSLSDNHAGNDQAAKTLNGDRNNTSSFANSHEGAVGFTNEKQEINKESVAKAIKAPIVGTFYRAGSPHGKPYVEVGSYVHKGDVVCVIEAMKLMNEVEAEEDGEVVEILIENEEMVEYDQPLIILR